MDTTGWRRNFKDGRILGKFYRGRWQGMPLNHFTHRVRVQTRIMSVGLPPTIQSEWRSMSITMLLYDTQKLQLSGTLTEYKWQCGAAITSYWASMFASGLAVPS